MTSLQVSQLAGEVIAAAEMKSFRLACAESCTGGLVSAALTDIPGASDVFTHGFVTYANEAKEDLLGVPHALLLQYGAVSAPVARAMAEGAKARAHADIAISVTGIAGPGGGTPEKPVGLVYMGIATSGMTRFYRYVFPHGSRGYIRELTVRAALRHLLATVKA